MVDTLGQAVPPTKAPAPDEQKKKELQSKWEAFFQRPEVAAGALQFGVNMLQPLAPGQTFAGQLGQSLGAGAQAAGRVQQRARTEEVQDRELGLQERRVAAEEEGVVVQREGFEVQRESIEQRRAASQQDFDVSMEQLRAANERHKDAANARDITLAAEQQRAILGAINKYNESGMLLEDFVPIAIDPTQFSEAELLKSAETIRTFRETGARPDTQQEAALARIKAVTPEQLAAQLRAENLTPETRGQLIKDFVDFGGDPAVVEQALQLLVPAVTPEGAAPTGTAPTGTAPAAAAPATDVGQAAQEFDAADRAANAVAFQRGSTQTREAITERRQRDEAAFARRTAALEAFKAALPDSVDALDEATFSIVEKSNELVKAIEEKYGRGTISTLRDKFLTPGR